MPAAKPPSNEQERLNALIEYQILDTVPDPGFEDLTTLAKKIFDTPIAIVSLIDKNRQWFKSCLGLDATETPREQAFCAYTILRPEPLIIDDARLDPRVKDNPLVTGDPHIRFYAGIPLTNANGYRLGSLCVIDTKPRTVNSDQISMLEILARQVVSQMERHKALIILEDKMQELKQAWTVAEENVQGRNSFFATMSHEIRTPITAIMGLSEILINEDEVSPFDSNQAAQTIFSNSRYLLEVLNNILDFSKLNFEGLSIEQRKFNIFELINETQSILDLKAIEKELLFLIDINYPFPEFVTSDPTRIKQVLINICSNAIKFTHNGSVKLLIQFLEDKNQIHFEVTDTGIGMTENEIKSLFQPYQQANQGISKKYGGTGLGLSIAKKIIETLGGEITVESKKDIGTSFKFWFPIEKVNPSVLVNSNPLLARQQEKEAELIFNGKVLVVEDEQINLRLISYLLEKIGLKVETAEDGKIGVAKALSGSFDLIFMDLQLPEQDGLSAIKQIKSNSIKTPIVALTASQDKDAIEACFNAGCSEYMPKPFHRRQLFNCVKRYISDYTELATEPSASNSEDNFSKLILDYSQKLATRVELIENDLVAKDWEKLRIKAHKLVGAGLFGFPKISLMAKLLEERASKKEAKEAHDIILRLKQEAQNAISNFSKVTD